MFESQNCQPSTSETYSESWQADDPAGAQVAIVIPCYNEEATIAKVVADFHAELPNAKIYVFDNNSTDQTIKEARVAGAHLAFERRQGKGYVVQRMFSDVEADVYVMV